jgi:DNA helicase HerA-like ATPase
MVELEAQGADRFFGEPEFDVHDLMTVTSDGRGVITALELADIPDKPALFSTFMMWLLAELYQNLPEAGDLAKPKLVFFFDEAHLLFRDASRAFLAQIEQVIRLIRSKGVGVYFVTQNPLDVPDEVLAQLGNRVQHALRAYTPRDQKAVKAAAETFRPNPKLNTAQVITELGVGEALVSFLEAKGAPSIVERCLIRPPSARVGPVTPEERKKIIAASPVRGQYDKAIDRESAFEMLQKRTKEKAAEAEVEQEQASGGGGGIGGFIGSIFGTNRKRGQTLSTTQRIARDVTRTVTNRVAGQVAAEFGKKLGGSMGGSVGRAIVRGTLGGILRR